MKKLVPLLALLFSFTIGVRGQTLSNYPILFKNEVVYPDKVEQNTPTIYKGIKYVVLQHKDLVISHDFYGFNTLEYLPKHSAFAKISVAQFENAKNALNAAGGRVLEIDPNWKLSVNMYHNNYPDWAWINDKQMKIWLSIWPELNIAEIKSNVRAEGFEVLEVLKDDRLIAIALNPEKIDEIMALPYVSFIQEMEDPGQPENFTARTSVRVNTLQQPFSGGLDYDGSGITVAHNDAGMLGEHIDFTGRLTQVGNSSSSSDHGDHTAGTIFGAGNFDPSTAGMAPGSDMYYTTYPNNLNNADNIYLSQNARLTSNSFSNGCNAGYTNFARRLDKDAFDNPLMLHVFSAGNNGSSNCGYGAGAGWGNVTGGHKQGKNVITVANFTRTDGLANSSSRGPANDGRIKPDIGAVGTQVNSTTDIPVPNSYDRKTGTSMSCPGVTGSLAVLMQAHKELNGGSEIPAALLKAYLLNGADDLGNAGPDFRYGYGRMNVKRSFDMLAGSQFFNDSLNTGDSVSFNITVPANTSQLKVMLYWADPEASTNSSRNLVNDLDLTVVDNSTEYFPWVLDPTPNVANLNSPAVRSRDSLNNMEQVTLSDPAAGQRTFKIKGHNVPSGPQEFYLVYYFEQDEIAITYPQKGDAVPTGRTELLRWDAPHNNTSGFTAEFSVDGGSTWLNLNPNINANARYVNWVVPNTTNDQIFLRVKNGNDTAVVGPITVVPVPGNLNITSACPDSVTLTWNNVSGASGYVVYKLGTKYMDSIAYLTSTTAKVPHNPLEKDYFAVASVVNDSSVGYRSIAIEKPEGIFNCDIEKDLEISEVLSPGRGEVADCGSGLSMPVILRVSNVGTDTVKNYFLGFNRSGVAPIIENVQDTLAPGASNDYAFTTGSAILLNNISLNYSYWVNSAVPDGNPFNDTVQYGVAAYSAAAPIDSFPYNQNFETFSNCGTDADCGFTSCVLQDGWRNATNFSADGLDFRVNSGRTPSNRTGPDIDKNPGSSFGKYLYTEASGTCDSVEGLLMTPCFNLNEVYGPEASIWYHMEGGDMGRLTADIFDGDRWYMDYAGVISGNQGTQWNELKFALDEFTGQTISIRFRAKTGNDFESDIALDDFSLVATSGVGLVETNGHFKVYPNPSTGNFVLENKNNFDGNITVNINTVTGAEVYHAAFTENAGRGKMRISLSNLPAGIYMLNLTGDNTTEVIKLVKK
jgi:hypothetical protein